MARNGSGTMLPVTNSWNPQVTGTNATGPDFAQLYTDLLSALTQSLSNDGQTPVVGNLAMGNNKLTGLAAGSATGDSLRWQQLFSQGLELPLASAASIDIGAQNSNFLNITGTATITSFGTNYNGPRFLRFSGINTLTNSATLVLPGGANITTAAGDTLVAYPLGNPATGWVVTEYSLAASNLGLISLAAADARYDARYAALAGLATQAFSMSTAAQFNSSTLGASTAFVQRALGSYNAVIGMAVAKTWTAVEAVGKLIYLNGTGNQGLPAASTMPSGSSIIFINLQGAPVSIFRSGAEVFYGGASGSGFAGPIILPNQGGVRISTDGTAYFCEFFNGADGLAAQTWQNLTGSRAQSTTYTNSTGREIKVSIYVAIGGSTTATLTVSGGAIATFSAGTSSMNATLFATIPIGATYSVSGATSLLTWWEER